MTIRLIVIGDIPDSDLRILTKVFNDRIGNIDFRIDILEDLSKISSESCFGYLSYLPASTDLFLNVFGSLPIGVGVQIPFYQKVESDNVPQLVKDFPLSGVFESPVTELNAINICESVLQHNRFVDQCKELTGEIVKYRKQKHRLIEIGSSLSKETDINKVLSLILTKTRAIVSADAGSVYVRDRDEITKTSIDTLRFKIAQNHSVNIGEKSKEFSIPINTNTIAGYVAHTGTLLNIEDVYSLDDSVPYKFGKDFDKQFGYRMKSMLTVPFKNMSGVIVGVVQLMNKKIDSNIILTDKEVVDKSVISFSYSDEEFVRSIASLAAVSIERAQLYDDIQQLFEGFLNSSIAAVDERDRVTSGHSRRVMGYALAFANAINMTDSGYFADEFFSSDRLRQFKFAALLHDIGKIGVPENLLTKNTRLSDGEITSLLSRFEFVKFHFLYNPDYKNSYWGSIDDIESDMKFIKGVNISGFLNDEDFSRLENIKNKKYEDSYGDVKPIINDSEWESLSVRKGNLTNEEREKINFHAQATRRILSKIPWTQELNKIPEIASHHHERLDGSGYPDHLTADEISLESRILAVVDIYEALVAQDRPYKPAMKPDKAISILRFEVEAGHLDSNVVDFFVDQNIYTIFL